MAVYYSAKVVESSKELSARERLMYKDTTTATKLDTILETTDSLEISPIGYVVLDIHNEKSETNKDFQNYVIIDSDGNRYVTGSPSFWKAFKEIWDEMEDEDEAYSIAIYKIDSKNYKGKKFLTCTIL